MFLLSNQGKGKSYANVEGKLKKDVHPEYPGVEVKRLRKSNNGGVLVELGSDRGIKEFTQVVKTVSGEVNKAEEYHSPSLCGEYGH